MTRLSRTLVFLATAVCLYGSLYDKADADSSRLENLIKNPGVGSLSIKGEGEWTTEVRGIKPNAYYLLSFRVKREGWKDGEYPYVKIFDRATYMDELFSWGGWHRVSYIVKSGNKNRTVLQFIGKGLSDKITFDDVSLRELQIFPMAPFDGTVIQDGPVEFKWAIPKDDRVFLIVIELARQREFRDRKIIVAFSPTGNIHKIKQPLANGNWYWRLSLYHNRRRLASSDVSSFTVSRKSPPDEARPAEAPLKSPVKSSNRFAQNGKAKFFPIGIYDAKIEAFDELKKAGFNLAQNYNSNPDFIKKFVAAAGSHGLKALSTLTGLRPSKNLSKLLDEIKDEPGLYGWYIADEPEGRGISPAKLWLWSRYIHSIDPGHPTALVNVRSRKVIDYAPAVDVAMVDPYPIPHMPMTWLSDSIDEARRAVRDKKPVWAVIQAFNWAQESKRLGKELARGKGRFPTYEEKRCLVYLSIVHGARGVIFFSYGAARRNDPDFKNWSHVKRIVSQLREIYPLLSTPDSGEKLSLHTNGAKDANGNPAIHYAIRKINSRAVPEKQGSIKNGAYLIAVNVIDRSVDAVFNGFSNRGKDADVLFENRTVPIAEEGLQDRFGPYAVHVYRLNDPR
ncbi:MAG: hypothetical protein ACE5G9_10950 [Nitrospinales bacterium]